MQRDFWYTSERDAKDMAKPEAVVATQPNAPSPA